MEVSGARPSRGDVAQARRPRPGMVRTEKVMEAAQWLDLSNSESPELVGRAVVALASDPDVLCHTGQVLVAAALGKNMDSPMWRARARAR